MATISDWLWKRGVGAVGESKLRHAQRGWRWRFVVLKSGRLQWHDVECDRADIALGTLLLSPASQVRGVQESHRQHVLLVEEGGKDICLQLSDQERLEDWIVAIGTCIQALQCKVLLRASPRQSPPAMLRQRSSTRDLTPPPTPPPKTRDGRQ